MLTLQALKYIEGDNQNAKPIWSPDTLKRMLNWITLSNSTTGNCTPMQVVKQPEHGEVQQLWKKMSFLLGKLWLIAKNSKNFPRKKQWLRNMSDPYIQTAIIRLHNANSILKLNTHLHMSISFGITIKLMTFDKNVPFSKNSVIVKHIWVNFPKSALSWRFRMLPWNSRLYPER